MVPTKDVQRLRRAAERKGKAEDQFQLACLFLRRDEGDRGQGESLVPLYTRESVSLSLSLSGTRG